MDVDVLIVGGGVAGLWALDHLRSLGYRALLVENRALGYGQTIGAQGIIHGGLKYSLRGLLTASADEIREMPLIWRECLSGEREPNLSPTTIRSHYCYLWQTSAVASQAGMLGAQLQLRVKPQAVSPTERPELLRDTPGQVFRLDEQVLSPASLLECFRKRNAQHVWKIDPADGLHWGEATAGSPVNVTLHCGGRSQQITARAAIMTAGAGNETLSQAAGKTQPMQRRPLHMVLAKGPLPLFQGHCVDGAKTRLTITAETISPGETVWQLGGQIAEQGVKQSPEELLDFAVQELQATLPGLDLTGVQFTTYRVDRAEKKSGLGLRPDAPQIVRQQNRITCWPTKLAFAPRLAQMLEQMLKQELHLQPSGNETLLPVGSPVTDWPAPAVASAPWQESRSWVLWTATGFTPVQNSFEQQAA